jgi:hypothetical protein
MLKWKALGGKCCALFRGICFKHASFLMTFEVTFRMQLKRVVLPHSVCWVEIFIFSILQSNNITEMYAVNLG